MKSFRLFKESIIDIPRRAYAPGVFDDEDTDNPKIKESKKRKKVRINLLLRVED